MIPWQAVPSFPSSFSVPFKGDQHLPCLHPGVRRDLEGLLKAVDFSEPHPGDGKSFAAHVLKEHQRAGRCCETEDSLRH